MQDCDDQQFVLAYYWVNSTGRRASWAVISISVQLDGSITINTTKYQICVFSNEEMGMEEEKKKEGTVEKSGEVVGKAAKKGADVVKGFGKGLVKGFKKEEEKK